MGEGMGLAGMRKIQITSSGLLPVCVSICFVQTVRYSITNKHYSHYSSFHVDFIPSGDRFADRNLPPSLSLSGTDWISDGSSGTIQGFG